jgi:hypothetical protein
MKKLIIILSLILSILSCKPKTIEKEPEKQKIEWNIIIDTYGFFGPSFRVFFESKTDSMIVNKWNYVLDTISNERNAELEKRIAILIPKKDKDSIYNITRRIFKNFEFPTTLNRVLDGSNISIQLKQNNTVLQCVYSNLNKIESPSFDVAKLVCTINNKLKEEEKIY